MAIPPEERIDDASYDRMQFAHFYVYMRMQLGRRMPSPTSHWSNAKLIASIPAEEIVRVTARQLEDRGFE